MSNMCNWGIGTNTDEDGLYVVYGYPVCGNPERFEPDPEMCTEEEIKNHKEALENKE